MLRLNLTRRAVWHDLGHGVRLLCGPVTSGVLSAARLDPVVAALISPPDGASSPALDGIRRDAVALAIAKSIARQVVQDWEGVGDEHGEPLSPSPDAVDVLLDLQPLFEAFQALVVAPAMLLVTEKNG